MEIDPMENELDDSVQGKMIKTKVKLITAIAVVLKRVSTNNFDIDITGLSHGYDNPILLSVGASVTIEIPSVIAEHEISGVLTDGKICFFEKSLRRSYEYSRLIIAYLLLHQNTSAGFVHVEL